VTKTPTETLDLFREYVRNMLKGFVLGDEIPTVNQTASWNTTRKEGGRRAFIATEMKGMEKQVWTRKRAGGSAVCELVPPRAIPPKRFSSDGVPPKCFDARSWDSNQQYDHLQLWS
jgi:hypothetical protein